METNECVHGSLEILKSFDFQFVGKLTTAYCLIIKFRARFSNTASDATSC